MKRLAWIDIEATDLKPAESDLLEICIIVTEADLTELATFHSLIKPPAAEADKWTAQDFADIANKWDSYVFGMHSDNGLIDDIVKGWGDLPTMREVELRLRGFLSAWNGGDKKNLYIGGSSVKFDWAFLEHYLPEVLEEVHYRVADVSSTRVQMEMLTGKDLVFKKEKGHRAEDDIRETIAEYGYLWRSFRDHLNVSGKLAGIAK